MGGLYRWDGKAFTVLTARDGLCGNTVIALGQDRFGNIWIGTQDGASR